MEILTLPTTTEELIDLLDKQFPDKCARLNESEREIFHKTGQRSVVEWLKDLQQRTEEFALIDAMENT